MCIFFNKLMLILRHVKFIYYNYNVWVYILGSDSVLELVLGLCFGFGFGFGLVLGLVLGLGLGFRF